MAVLVMLVALSEARHAVENSVATVITRLRSADEAAHVWTSRAVRSRIGNS